MDGVIAISDAADVGSAEAEVHPFFRKRQKRVDRFESKKMTCSVQEWTLPLFPPLNCKTARDVPCEIKRKSVLNFAYDVRAVSRREARQDKCSVKELPQVAQSISELPFAISLVAMTIINHMEGRFTESIQSEQVRCEVMSASVKDFVVDDSFEQEIPCSLQIFVICGGEKGKTAAARLVAQHLHLHVDTIDCLHAENGRVFEQLLQGQAMQSLLGHNKLVLLDDLDIAFAGDENFWNMAGRFLRKTTLPVIVTCQDFELLRMRVSFPPGTRIFTVSPSTPLQSTCPDPDDGLLIASINDLHSADDCVKYSADLVGLYRECRDFFEWRTNSLRIFTSEVLPMMRTMECANDHRNIEQRASRFRSGRRYFIGISRGWRGALY